MIREITLADERFLAQITDASFRQIRGYLNEPIDTPHFANHVRSTRTFPRAP